MDEVERARARIEIHSVRIKDQNLRRLLQECKAAFNSVLAEDPSKAPAQYAGASEILPSVNERIGELMAVL